MPAYASSRARAAPSIPGKNWLHAFRVFLFRRSITSVTRWPRDRRSSVVSECRWGATNKAGIRRWPHGVLIIKSSAS